MDGQSPPNPQPPRADSLFHVVLRRLAQLLNEALMGFLALVAMGLGLAPMLFQVSRPADTIMNSVQSAIVVLFAAEYLTHLFLAERKAAYALNPWRLLDLAIIATASLALVLDSSDLLQSSPMLRLLRLPIVLYFGARAGGAIIREEARRHVPAAGGAPEVSLLTPDDRQHPKRSSWGEFVGWLANPRGAWYHLSNVGEGELEELARAHGVSRPLLESCLSDANYPRLEVSGRGALLSVWLPVARVTSRVEVERTSVVLMSTADSLITVSRRPCNLHDPIADSLHSGAVPDAPFATHMTYAFLRMLVKHNEEVTGHLERQLRALEQVPMHETRQEFFKLAFQLRKELSAAKADLWRVSGILSALAEARVRIPGHLPAHQEFLRDLAGQADYLHETVEDLREGLVSVLDLHLNLVSFEMNKFMRLLAVVGMLGLIPAVVGGLLGMNLIDQPWHMTLPQITFGVFMAMLFCLYFFMVKGWLR